MDSHKYLKKKKKKPDQSEQSRPITRVWVIWPIRAE